MIYTISNLRWSWMILFASILLRARIEEKRHTVEMASSLFFLLIPSLRISTDSQSNAFLLSAERQPKRCERKSWTRTHRRCWWTTRFCRPHQARTRCRSISRRRSTSRRRTRTTRRSSTDPAVSRPPQISFVWRSLEFCLVPTVRTANLADCSSERRTVDSLFFEFQHTCSVSGGGGSAARSVRTMLNLFAPDIHRNYFISESILITIRLPFFTWSRATILYNSIN